MKSTNALCEQNVEVKHVRFQEFKCEILKWLVMLLTHRYRPAEYHPVRWNKFPFVRNNQSAVLRSVQIQIAELTTHWSLLLLHDRNPARFRSLSSFQKHLMFSRGRRKKLKREMKNGSGNSARNTIWICSQTSSRYASSQ